MIDKYTFCHIPKTGGTTICSLIYGHAPSHRICSRKDSQPFIFTFVRNPYTRTLSAYKYLLNGGNTQTDIEDKHKYLGNSTNFNLFVKNKLEYTAKYQQHFRPQYYWLPDGADFIGYYENFQSDIEKLRKIIVMRDISIPHKNKTNYDHNYMIPKDTKDIIYNIYKKDFELFGYLKDNI